MTDQTAAASHQQQLESTGEHIFLWPLILRKKTPLFAAQEPCSHYLPNPRTLWRSLQKFEFQVNLQRFDLMRERRLSKCAVSLSHQRRGRVGTTFINSALRVTLHLYRDSSGIYLYIFIHKVPLRPSKYTINILNWAVINFSQTYSNMKLDWSWAAFFGKYILIFLLCRLWTKVHIHSLSSHSHEWCPYYSFYKGYL